MRYKSVADMVLSLSSFGFSMRYLLTNQHKMERVLPIYQENFRIYLDEYPEQKELREEFLKKWYYWENIRKQYELSKNKLIAKAIGEPYISKIPRYSVVEELKDFFERPAKEIPELKKLFEEPSVFEDNPYQHFIDRFNKRN